MIRQQAFTGDGRFLKGGLHCHTTRSDGQGTPEEVIKMHVEHGYDFLALTDHRFYNLKNFTDLPITIIPGMEIDSDIPDGMECHCFHEVCLGDPATTGFKQDERVESVDSMNQFEFQPQLDAIHAKNNMTFYCHPEWSATPAQEFMHLKGNFAMEIWNSGCVVEDHQDMNAAYWDELLYDGQKIWGVATDDGHKMYQHCLGWVMVNAENNVPAILKALKEGAFYASAGPEIFDFTFEGDTVSVKCSDAKCIEFYSRGVPTRLVEAPEDGVITEGSWFVPKRAKYVRACVIDKDGRRAWTNPIFLEGVR